MEQITHGQSVAILIDGNNIERSIASAYGKDKMLNYDTFIPYILKNRPLIYMDYFIEGIEDGTKKSFSERLDKKFFGNIHRCHKSADVPLSMHAAKIMNKVNTIIIMSGDADYCDTVDFLMNNGVRIEVCCVYGTGSKALLSRVNNWTYIQDRDCYALDKTMPVTKEEFNSNMEKLESDNV